jgi:hypothetical protein
VSEIAAYAHVEDRIVSAAMSGIGDLVARDYARGGAIGRTLAELHRALGLALPTSSDVHVSPADVVAAHTPRQAPAQMPAQLMDEAIAKTARAYEVSIDDLRDRSRTSAAGARHVAIYLSSRFGIPSDEIAEHFHLSRPTVTEALKDIGRRVLWDRAFDEEIEELRRQLETG